MNVFKVGDKVNPLPSLDYGSPFMSGTVVQIQNDSVLIEWPEEKELYWWNEKFLERAPTEVEKLKTEKPTLTLVGKKYDNDKPDLSLLPKEALEAAARAFQYGEKKYGRYNYLAGMDWHRLVAAALRHITAFNDGEDLDSESGFSHLGHAMACLSMLIAYQARSLGKDTRYKP